jgi:hypothetical protein
MKPLAGSVSSIVNNLNSYCFIRPGRVPRLLTTEYEQLLGQLLEEKKAILAKLNSEGGKAKQADQVRSDMRFIEIELEHYRDGMKLFRSKSVPKVGRWGRPEAGEHAGAAVK